MAMTLTERRQRAAERKARDERAARVAEAVADERGRFNRAIARGAAPVLQTHAGAYVVGSVNANWEYHTPKANGGYGSTWAGCNNYVWADLMAQVGEPRNPLFAG